jgi:C1A family cysteine protease
MNVRKIKGYGWKPSLPDPRDLYFKISAPVPLPPKVDLAADVPAILNQESLGSCTANALATAYQFTLLKQKEKEYFTPSRLFIYYNERAIERTINSDSGAMLRDGMKVLNKIGTCDEVIWPYKIKEFKKQPPSPCFVQALKNKITQYERIDGRNLYLIKQCLAKGHPFVFGFTVFDSFESQEVADTGIMPMPTNSERMLGGHAVCAVGYDDATGMIKVQNSWGTEWGDNGYFYMPYEFITNPQLCSDFWTITFI